MDCPKCKSSFYIKYGIVRGLNVKVVCTVTL